MYLEHWQLEQKPFEPRGSAPFYFASESHQGALLKLRYAVENGRGAAVVAGPSGVGKTLLVQKLIDELPEATRPVVQVVYPQMPARELLAYIAARLGPPEEPTALTPTMDQSWLRIETLLEQAAERGERPLLVVDEAHLLEDSGTLETIRLLLNLQRDGVALVTVLLVGHNSLVATLARTPRLEERLDISAMIDPLSANETASYIGHRLSVAGAPSELFSNDAIGTLYQLSHGVPRRINRLGDLALLVGYANGAQVVDAALVQSVASELAFARAA